MTWSMERLLDEVIAREGGFVHHPADRGGPTKYGITQATLPRSRSRTRRSWSGAPGKLVRSSR
jgi:lysozyme family protein